MMEKENLSQERMNPDLKKNLEKDQEEKEVNNDVKIQYKNRGITKYEFKLLWSIIAFTFIFGLCWLFNTPAFLWMLIGWLMWMI